MKELYELIKYLKDNGYEHIKINPDLLVGIVEYFESKQEPKKCTLTDVSKHRELLKAYAKLIQKDYTNHFFDDAVEESIDQFLAIDYRLRCEEFADGKCRPIVNADWTYLRCKCGKRFEPKG